MSSTERRPGRIRMTLAYWVAGAVAGLSAFLYLTLGISTPPTAGPGKAGGPGDNALEAARSALAKDTDLSTCRSALQQINTHLGRDPGPRPPARDPAEKERLRARFGLDDGEQAEVDSGTYTLLDGHYLDCCFLLRDAADSLDVKAPGAAGGGPALRPAPLDRAAAAFAWVVRQVRLQDPTVRLRDVPGGDVVPPAFVLRRGWGTALERALVFLALLEQVGHGGGEDAGLVGCLVLRPGTGPAGQRLWACGVAARDPKALPGLSASTVGLLATPPGPGPVLAASALLPGRTDPSLYLLDPRLGLPLPGPGGQGVATLAAARTDPAVLAQLTTDPRHPYDVTAEQARAAEVYQVCPLSGLAPRMGTLQDQLLPPAVRVRLAADPDADRKRLKAAAGAPGGPGAEVRVWQEGTGLLRRFLPPDEGGVDPVHPFPLRELTGFTTRDDPAVVQMQRRQLFVVTLAPWAAFPPLFRNPDPFRFDIGLGRRVHDFFLHPFVQAALEPGGPRDLVLRGRFTKAAPELVQELERRQQQLNRLRAAAPALGKEIRAWVERAEHAYADLERAQRRNAPEAVAAADKAVEDLWKEQEAEPVYTLLLGALAGPRSAEGTYLLALCKHEQAERLQARLHLAARVPGVARHETDVHQAHNAWKDARGWWTRFGEEYASHPSLAAESAAARRLLGRAQAMLGDREAAVASWRNPSGALTPLEKTAALYRVQRLAKRHAPR
jgi:hypothetical protein